MFQDGSGGRPTLLADLRRPFVGATRPKDARTRAAGTGNSPDQFRPARWAGGPGPVREQGGRVPRSSVRQCALGAPVCKLRAPTPWPKPAGETRPPSQRARSGHRRTGRERSAREKCARHRLENTARAVLADPATAGGDQPTDTELNPPGRRCGPTRLLLSGFTYS